jgi:hypothetical protein
VALRARRLPHQTLRASAILGPSHLATTALLQRVAGVAPATPPPLQVALCRGDTPAREGRCGVPAACASGKHLAQVLNSTLNSPGGADAAWADCVNAVAEETDWSPVRQDWHH